MEEVSLGKRLEELRTKLGYTQTDISSLLGIDQGMLSEYEFWRTESQPKHTRKA